MSKFSWLKYLALAAALLGATQGQEVSSSTETTTANVTETTFRISSTAPLSTSIAPASHTADTTTSSPAATSTAISTTPSGGEDCDNANVTIIALNVTSNSVSLKITYNLNKAHNITILNKTFELSENESEIIEVIMELTFCRSYELNATLHGKCQPVIKPINIITHPPSDRGFELQAKIQPKNEIHFELTEPPNMDNCNLLYNWNCNSLQENVNDHVIKVVNATPCQQYSCSVDIQQKSSTWTKTVNKSIKLEYEKPNKPDINYTKRSTMSIAVDWSVQEADLKPVTSVEITCTAIDNSRFSVTLQNVTKGSAICKGLNPYTNYTVNVTAINKMCNNTTQSNSHTSVVMTRPSYPGVPVIKTVNFLENNKIELICVELKQHEYHGKSMTYSATANGHNISKSQTKSCNFIFENLQYLTTYELKLFANNGDYTTESRAFSVKTRYNDKALIGFLVFLIIATSIALTFVLYKI